MLRNSHGERMWLAALQQGSAEKSMKERNTTWASTLAIIVAMLGCGDAATGGTTTTPVTGNSPATASPTTPAAAGGARAPAAATPAANAAAGARATTPTTTATAGASATTTPTASAAGSSATTSAAGASATAPTSTAGTTATAAAGSGSAAAGTSAAAAAGSGAAEPGVVTNCGTAEHGDITKGPGPFTPKHIENGGKGSSWVFFPTELGRDGCKHPIFNWGPGAGTGPSNYKDHLNHLASHGFVIISQPSSGDGSDEKPALEWLMKQNETMGSQFFGKLDTKKVVMGGHSMGALTTFAMADYAPLTHYILVCGGSFGAPMGAEKIHGPAIILGGDTDSGTPNFEDDYMVIPTPKIFLIKSGTDHVACARNNLEPWTEFMRWQLYGETKWKANFFDGGKYCKAPWDSCESKGW